jgi:hypothetical protein
LKSHGSHTGRSQHPNIQVRQHARENANENNILC